MPGPKIGKNKVDSKNHLDVLRGLITSNQSYFRAKGLRTNKFSFYNQNPSFFRSNLYKESLELKLLNFNPDFFERKKNLWDDLIFDYTTQINQSNSLGVLLFENLLTAFLQSIEADTSVAINNVNLAGIYIIYNSNSKYCYIGESKNIYKRFENHCDDLLLLKHSNSNLLKAYIESEKDLTNFHFLVWDYGLALREKRERLQKEKDLIKSWPGGLYNILNNTH